MADCRLVDRRKTPRSQTAATEDYSELPNRAFHLQLDEALELDAVLHRELADEIVNETIDAQAHSLRLAESALLHVENLLCAHLTDAGLVLHCVPRAAHGDRRVCVGAAG